MMVDVVGLLCMLVGVWCCRELLCSERCRVGRYAVNALRCDVWVVCACIAMCIVACFVGFWWKCIPNMTCFCIFRQSAFL